MIYSEALLQLPSRFIFLSKQLFKYVLAGGLAFVVDYTTFFLFTQYGNLHYLLASTAGFMLGLVVNYLLCIGWIFNQRAIESRTQEFAVFTLIGIAGLVLNNGLMYIATEQAGIHYLISKLLAATCVLLFNFGLRRYFIFTDFYAVQ